MWDLIESIATVVIIVLVIMSFWPKRYRTAVSHYTRRTARIAGDNLADLWRALRPLAYRLITGDDAPKAVERPSRTHRSNTNRTEPNTLVRDESPLPAAESEPNEPTGSVRGPAPVLTLSADELAAVVRMIEHKRTAARPTKSSTIQAAFGVSRGGGATYGRASELYDRFFAAPAEAIYPTLAAEREKVAHERGAV